MGGGSCPRLVQGTHINIFGASSLERMNMFGFKTHALICRFGISFRSFCFFHICTFGLGAFETRAQFLCVRV